MTVYKCTFIEPHDLMVMTDLMLFSKQRLILISSEAVFFLKKKKEITAIRDNAKLQGFLFKNDIL